MYLLEREAPLIVIGFLKALVALPVLVTLPLRLLDRGLVSHLLTVHHAVPQFQPVQHSPVNSVIAQQIDVLCRPGGGEG